MTFKRQREREKEKHRLKTSVLCYDILFSFSLNDEFYYSQEFVFIVLLADQSPSFFRAKSLQSLMCMKITDTDSPCGHTINPMTIFLPKIILTCGFVWEIP